MNDEAIKELLLSDNEEDNYLGIIIMGKYKPYNIETKADYKNLHFFNNPVPVYILDLLKVHKKRTIFNHVKYIKLMRRYESEYKGDDIK